ncbi:MarR family winged helix-turn-helix transcriptional regulator [Blautia schinkii]|nr:MarR family winged helix-turn-helix transcriptional regulator [Blautia schinkii]
MHNSKGHGKGWTVDEPEDLDGLLRACGHYLYHKAAGAKSGQGKIMHILSSQKEISQKELQEHLGIQPGSISEILSKMENKGLLQRIKDGEDRRKTIVRITDAGEHHVEEFRKNGKGDRNKDIFSALDDGQKEELKKLLRILLESWK